MSSPRRPTRWLSLVLASSLGFTGLMQSAQAAMIGTAEVAAAQAAAADASTSRAYLAQALNRDDVVQALQARGVDAAEARARVAALSDEQAQWLVQQMDQAPAGASDILGALVFIFVLLLVTDILGLTKVFPFTRSAR